MRRKHWFLTLAGAAVLFNGITAAAAETVTLSMILIAPEDRWNFLLDAAKARVERTNPDLEIRVDAQILPFSDRLTRLRAAAVGRTPLDIVSLDQPEVGEFAAAGFTLDLTGRIDRDLNGLADWLPAYREATKFGDGWHAIWAWTDARVLWYWKDLVAEAGVDPATDMATWDGYLASCETLNAALRSQGIEGCLLIGQPWVADWTFPYQWMKGGALGVAVNPAQAERLGAAEAWVPTLDSQAWVDALQFTSDQVAAGIKPYTEHQFGTEFVRRQFATTLDGTWVYGSYLSSGADPANLGMVAAFPVPEGGVQTTTMAGGWTLAIPRTSENPDAAWEFLKAMLAEDTLGATQVKFGYLPTRASFAEGLRGDFAQFWNQGDENRWTKLEALAPNAYGRPSFPSWPQVAETITEMVQRVMFDNVDPSTAAGDAQKRALTDVLKWPAGTTVSLHDDAGGTCGEPDTDRLLAVVTPGQQAVDADGNGQICSRLELPQ